MLISLLLGMTNANMKLVVLGVNLDDKMEAPDPKLDAGEFIVKRVVELAKLYDELKGIHLSTLFVDCAYPAYCKFQRITRKCEHDLPGLVLANSSYILQGFVVDARLSHFASGYEMARIIKD
jgi:ADP-ribose pyrophosphatase